MPLSANTLFGSYSVTRNQSRSDGGVVPAAEGGYTPIP